MPEIPIDIKDSSSDEEVIKAKMTKLTRTNWVQWSCQFENYLISKGMEDLLDPPTEDVKKTSKFRKRNGGSLTLLWSSVSTEFEGVLLNNKSSFYNCWVGLGNCCGKNSVVVICRTLHKLVNLRYEPGTSLEKHIDDFHKIHASYLSISVDSSISMNLSSSMAAAFFLQSLDNDKELSSLCQTLYDLKPFELNTITDRVSIEHSRRESSHDQVLLIDNSKQAESSKTKEKNKSEGGRKKTGYKDKKKGKNNNQGTVKKPSQEQETNRRIERIEQLLEKLQHASQSMSVNATSESKELIRLSGSDSDAFIIEEVNAMIGKNRKKLIYLDSGAGRTVVNDLTLLEDPTPINKHINTFSNPVKVTHQGTLPFKGIKLFPVYYVPNGPVNLLSVSQLCDHGMKLISKNNLFLIKYHNRIVDTFHRQGNLFVSKLSSNSNSIYTLPTTELDWHLTLGHPSDLYIEALLKDQKINGYFTPSSECPVCHQAKIRNRPHSQVLPRVNAPFFKIHMDTLQINPPSRKGHKYVLVLIDDFSRFNRIYLLSEKSQAAEHIKSYLMEIKNKLNITPAYLHTDRGGEFSSQLFIDFLTSQGISLERGPPESPQTNGVAERFNQTLLSKIRCLLGQSNIPMHYWDEAAAHGSLLLNLLPHKHLKMKTPLSVLKNKSSLIEPEVDLKKLIPFGIKVTVRIINTSSKIEPRGEVLRALTFEKYSDGLRVLNLETGKIRVSRDYTLSGHNPTLSMNQPASVLPSDSSVRIKLRLPSSRPSDPPTQSIDLESPMQPSDPQDTSTQVHTSAALEPLKNYEYVPYYKEAPRNISSSINEGNIITRKRHSQYRDNVLLTDIVPYSKALIDPIEASEWKKAMDEEYHSLTSHNTGELVPYPAKPAKVIGGMWRLSRKRNEYGEVYRHKARWVVLGNHQEHMLHYYDTWASVGRNETFKVMLSLVINFNYVPYQFDVETAFLHGEMDALVYVKQVKGYEVKGKENWVWRLRKSLYGTKQAPRMWKAKLTATLNNLGLASSQSDESLFVNNDKTLLLHVHVDDGFIISKSEDAIIVFLDKLNNTLKLKYKKRPTQHLGYNLKWCKNELKINQTDLIVKLLRQFGMEECKSVKTPCNGNFLNEIGCKSSNDVIEVTQFQQAIGSLNYLAHHTRPDVLFTVNQLSKHSTKPSQPHWNALKHLFRYLKGTKDKCLVYRQQSIKEALTGWADADYANDNEDRKSITGYVILAFSNPICWLSKKQSVVAQSTTEAEYIAMNICSKQLRWLTFVFNDLGHFSPQPILFNDNSGAVTISKQASLNANTKHIEIRYQYVRDCVMKKLIRVVQVSTNDMIADVLTKPLGVVKLQEVYKQLHLEDPGGVLIVRENRLG
ncbi:hypothetical protein O181_073334 [Austropuccinia psidii MF-1]|uniref:Integrase catalytic domain-containing protein n=1 Tax=Austropuccinia psidii MF-1 TaxID=1389203 RepID=A0A9Q3ICC6_9BASI|nr:hypothetical protein [Austropuccinia psidii MF-1]